MDVAVVCHMDVAVVCITFSVQHSLSLVDILLVLKPEFSLMISEIFLSISVMYTLYGQPVASAAWWKKTFSQVQLLI
jgi:hypothetical protein